MSVHKNSLLNTSGIASKLANLILGYKALSAILVVTFLLRIPSFFEPLWYGDEAIYLTIGQKILRGGIMYADIFDHKTPGIYYLTASAIGILGQSVWSIKFLLMILVLFTLIAFYFLGKKLFDEKISAVATAILAFFISTTIIEGNIFNSEILMILPISIGIILGLRKNYFWAGVFFSLAFLLKVPAVFDFGAFFLFIILAINKKTIFEVSKNLLRLASGFSVPILLTALYFFSVGALDNYFQSAILFNISYTGFGNKFIINNGLLLIKAIPLLLIVFYSGYRVYSRARSNKINSCVIYEFLIMWLILSFYGAAFGGRDYEHYLIQVVPSFSLVAAVTIFKPQFRKIGAAILISILLLIYLLNFRPWFRTSYYTNVFRFAANSVSFDQYADSFDRNSSNNYAIASFLTGCEKYDSDKKCIQTRTEPGDKIYVYGNHSAIYFLSGLEPASTYITLFHVENNKTAQKSTYEEIVETKPKYIITSHPLPNSFPALEKLLSSGYNLFAFYETSAIYQIKKSTFPLLK